MKSLNSILLGVAALCGLALTSCSNQNETFEQISQKVESEYSILQEPETKGIYAPITGVGSYPYGSNITLGTDEGYTIMMRKDGSQDWTDAHSTSYTITDLSNNWWVRGEAASTITFKAGTGGKIGTPTSIYGKIGGTATGPTATPDEGYNFAQWSDGTTNNPWVETIPNTSSTITAQFGDKIIATLNIYWTTTLGMNGNPGEKIYEAAVSLNKAITEDQIIVAKIEHLLGNPDPTTKESVIDGYAFIIPAGKTKSQYIEVYRHKSNQELSGHFVVLFRLEGNNNLIDEFIADTKPKSKLSM